MKVIETESHKMQLVEIQRFSTSSAKGSQTSCPQKNLTNVLDIQIKFVNKSAPLFCKNFCGFLYLRFLAEKKNDFANLCTYTNWLRRAGKLVKK